MPIGVSRFSCWKNFMENTARANSEVLLTSEDSYHPQIPVTKKPRIHVQGIAVNDGTTINLTENQIVVFVGPNNVGKSVTLKEMHSLIKSPNKNTTVVKSIELRFEGSEKEVLDIVKTKLKPREDNKGQFHLPDYNMYVTAENIAERWVTGSSIPQFSGLFTKFLSTEDRLKVSIPPKAISVIDGIPEEPIQYLQVDDDFEKRFSRYFKQAFGQDLIVNKGAGGVVPLHVGIAPVIKSVEDRVHRDYLLRLGQLPTLDKQGDGMRSFVGVLLSAFVSESVLFIDEPEAFLHPPQAYILGQMIANGLPPDKQIFLSTHSEDLLKGLLATVSGRIKIVRIQREDNINTFNILDSEAIKDLWKDPLLKYSNILSGLFHSRVIICESDGDCRFYGAMIDAATEGTDQVKPDILFVHCGGKQRIPTVINALVNLGMKVTAITDFDVLNDKSPLKEIYEGLGGTWNEIEADWREVKKSVDSKKPELDTSAVKARIENILAEVTNDTFPNAKSDEIRKVLKKSSPWSEAKSIGKNYIPPGTPNQKLTLVMERCRALGLNILDVGELECFDRSISGHGPTWVNTVLEKDLRNDPELEVARRFVSQLLAS